MYGFSEAHPDRVGQARHGGGLDEWWNFLRYLKLKSRYAACMLLVPSYLTFKTAVVWCGGGGRATDETALAHIPFLDRRSRCRCWASRCPGRLLCMI